jgi:hypothetical protein
MGVNRTREAPVSQFRRWTYSPLLLEKCRNALVPSLQKMGTSKIWKYE